MNTLHNIIDIIQYDNENITLICDDNTLINIDESVQIFQNNSTIINNYVTYQIVYNDDTTLFINVRDNKKLQRAINTFTNTKG